MWITYETLSPTYGVHYSIAIRVASLFGIVTVAWIQQADQNSHPCYIYFIGHFWRHDGVTFIINQCATAMGDGQNYITPSRNKC